MVSSLVVNFHIECLEAQKTVMFCSDSIPRLKLLVPFFNEGTADLGFFSVAVVRKSDSDAALTLDVFKHRKACVANSILVKGLVGSLCKYSEPLRTFSLSQHVRLNLREVFLQLYCVNFLKLFSGFIGTHIFFMVNRHTFWLLSDLKNSSLSCSAEPSFDQLFEKVCAPDMKSESYCSGCRGQSCPKECSATQYCGFDGALRYSRICLIHRRLIRQFA